MLACYLFRRHMTSQSTIYFLLFLRYMSSTNYLLFPVSVGMWHQKSIIHFRSFGMWRQKLTISPPVPPPPCPGAHAHRPTVLLFDRECPSRSFYKNVYNQPVWQSLHSILMKRSDEAFRSSFCLLCNSLGKRGKKPIFRFKSPIWGTNQLCPCKRRKETLLQVEDLSINDNRSAFSEEIMKRMVLCVIFWVFPRRLIIECRRFGTLYLFHLQRLDIKCSETSAFNNQTPGKYPKDYTQYSKHGESLKSRKEWYFKLKIFRQLHGSGFLLYNELFVCLRCHWLLLFRKKW